MERQRHMWCIQRRNRFTVIWCNLFVSKAERIYIYIYIHKFDYMSKYNIWCYIINHNSHKTQIPSLQLRTSALLPVAFTTVSLRKKLISIIVIAMEYAYKRDHILLQFVQAPFASMYFRTNCVPNVVAVFLLATAHIRCVSVLTDRYLTIQGKEQRVRQELPCRHIAIARAHSCTMPIAGEQKESNRYYTSPDLYCAC